MITRDNVHKVADGLGLPIDENIRDIVVRFNELHFTTEASCEGHKDWGLPYPWLDFPAPGRWLEMVLKDFYESDEPKLCLEKYASWDRLRYVGENIEEGRQEMERFLTWFEERQARAKEYARENMSLSFIDMLKIVFACGFEYFKHST